MVNLKYYKMYDTVKDPVYATDGAAAFDVFVHLKEKMEVRQFNPHNREMAIPVKVTSLGCAANVMPDFRVLIPTGLKFDIPEGYYLELVIRSGTALKFGLVLANQVGIIDTDYVDELFIMVQNRSDTPMLVKDGDRIAQVLLKKKEEVTMEETKEVIEPKTNRVGGLGSTGTDATIIVNNVVTEKRKPGRPKVNT